MSAPSDAQLRHELKHRLLALPPRAFELFTGDLLEFMGLHDVAVTRYSGDGGIDATASLATSTALISIPTGVQVKRYRTNVPRPDIDRFIGALSGHFVQGIFITTAGYTKQAVEKARISVPRVATVDGDQVVRLMLHHRLGIAERAGRAAQLDEDYFNQFEAQAIPTKGTREQSASYLVSTASQERSARPEEDVISLRALSHALRIDTKTLRRWMDRGQLRADQPNVLPNGGYFFRRDRIETIRATLFGKARPANADAWRQEFLDFARSRNLTKSYKPVLLKVLLQVIDRNGEAPMSTLVAGFRAFYVARRQAGLPVEFGPPDISNVDAVSDTQLRRLIVRHPLERFLIKGFLSYTPEDDIVRFAPQLWEELRFWELLAIQQSADEQLSYYYHRSP